MYNDNKTTISTDNSTPDASPNNSNFMDFPDTAVHYDSEETSQRIADILGGEVIG